MDPVKIVWTGDFAKAIDNWIEQARKAIPVALTNAGADVVDAAQAQFDTGDGPHNITGTLSGSIIVADITELGNGYEARIGPSGVEYARKVELTGHAYLEPGLGRATHDLIRHFVDAWSDAQKG